MSEGHSHGHSESSGPKTTVTVLVILGLVVLLAVILILALRQHAANSTNPRTAHITLTCDTRSWSLCTGNALAGQTHEEAVTLKGLSGATILALCRRHHYVARWSDSQGSLAATGNQNGCMPQQVTSVGVFPKHGGKLRIKWVLRTRSGRKVASAHITFHIPPNQHL